MHTDSAAAREARQGSVDADGLAGVVAVTDGASRAFDLLDTHTAEQFARLALRGELAALAESIRCAEDQRAGELRSLGMKAHDDLTIVATPLATSGPTAT